MKTVPNDQNMRLLREVYQYLQHSQVIEDDPTAKQLFENLEDHLFRCGEMTRHPCFRCGYKGRGYYQPNVHQCAEKHHSLT